MKKINRLMEDVNTISKVPFKLSNKTEDIYISSDFKKNDNTICEQLDISETDFKITVNKSEEKVLPLLSYYIKSVISKTNYQKDKMILDVLEGKDVVEDELFTSYPFFTGKFSIISIYLENNIEDALIFIEEGYSDEDASVVLFENKIIIVGKLNEAYEHALSIKETLASNFSGKSIISYCMVNKYTDTYECLNKCNSKISTALRFNIQLDILGEKELIFEEIVESISEIKKKELIQKSNKGFGKIDAEMVKTIEIFFKCGLNVSEGAKELFIHRNTLIYRLDKIQKYTGFDIRNFNDAVLVKIIFLIWKGKKWE